MHIIGEADECHIVGDTEAKLLDSRKGSEGDDIIEGENGIGTFVALQQTDGGLKRPVVVEAVTYHEVTINGNAVLTQSLRKEAPRVIGVVVPNLVTHYYAAVLDGIEDEARKEGYSVISANTHEDTEAEIRAIDNFISLHVEGIIACLSQNTTDYSHFEEIANMGIPLVFFGRTCLSDRFSSVTANGDEAAYQATQHLIDTGSRRIAFIGGPNHLDMVKRRKHGYLEALRENRIPIDRTLVACEKIDYQWALDTTTRLLNLPVGERPDAILAFNDIITFAAFTAIKQQGLSIPEDVALIGFTDDVHAQYVTPRMSAIEDQSHQMGKTACQLLLKSISGDTKIYRKIVPQKLVIRETSSRKTKL